MKKSYVVSIGTILALIVAFIVGFQGDLDLLMYSSVLVAIGLLFYNFISTQEKNEKALRKMAAQYQKENPESKNNREPSEYQLMKARTQEFVMNTYGFLVTDSKKERKLKTIFAIVLTLGIGSQLITLVFHGGLGGKILGIMFLYWAYQLGFFLLTGVHLADIVPPTESTNKENKKKAEDDSCARCGRYASRTYCDSCDRQIQPHLYKYQDYYKKR